MKFLVINGANLNMLGRRDPRYYGTLTLSELNGKVKEYADKLGAAVEFFASNHEGAIIDKLQTTDADAVILNAGAYTHYSYCIRDAIECITPPVCEVHLSDITAREPFRQVDVLRDVCVGCICGKKEGSYFEAMELLVKLL
jgi:3-dehydroquinate dehydratase-2